MQVGDYISRMEFTNIANPITIGLITDKYIDGYYQIEWQASHNTPTKSYSKHDPRLLRCITCKDMKLYHPTLEELFIFKSFKEQPC